MDSIINNAINNENRPKERRINNLDPELEELLSQQNAKIKVIGPGGAGNNTINRINEVGVVGAETVAINTDAQDLLYTSADKKILIGKDLTKGLGAGSNPKNRRGSCKRIRAWYKTSCSRCRFNIY